MISLAQKVSCMLCLVRYFIIILSCFHYCIFVLFYKNEYSMALRCSNSILSILIFGSQICGPRKGLKIFWNLQTAPSNHSGSSWAGSWEGNSGYRDSGLCQRSSDIVGGIGRKHSPTPFAFRNCWSPIREPAHRFPYSNKYNCSYPFKDVASVTNTPWLCLLCLLIPSNIASHILL